MPSGVYIRTIKWSMIDRDNAFTKVLENEIKFCECGHCKNTRYKYDNQGRERKFIYGHSMNNIAGIYGFKKGHTSWSKGKNKDNCKILKEHSERMKKNNPMKNSNISCKVVNTNIRNGNYKKQSERMKNGGGLKARISNKYKPNKPENILIKIIKKNDFPFNYVGDDKIWFKGDTQSFNPDFLSKNPKHIIELFGDYWHKDTQKDDAERLATYSKYGYKTLVIWEHELKNPIEVVNKIRNFIK